MTQQWTTKCFTCQVESLAATNAAHNHPAVPKISVLVLHHPALLRDVSQMLLRRVPIIPPGTPPISSTYKRTKGGHLRPEEQELAALLDDIYSTQDEDILAHLRGIVLERIVLDAVASRAKQNDVVLDNVNHITLPKPHTVPICSYSVDVAACFPSAKRSEFYACKLRSGRFTERDLKSLDKIGDAFAAYGGSVTTAICCLEQRDRIDEDLLDMLLHFPWIDLHTVENLLTLMTEPEKPADDTSC